MSDADVALIRSLQPPPDADVATLFADPVAWSAFAQASESAFEENFTSLGVGAPQGDVQGEGFDGMRAVFAEWLSPWASYHSTVEKVVSAGDRVMILVRDRGVSRHDGVAIELRAASIWTMRDGRIARVEFHVDRDRARAAFER